MTSEELLKRGEETNEMDFAKRKMTDNEIINGLKCCADKYKCENCDFFKHDTCFVVSEKEISDLINRQKVEIKQKDTEIDILIRKKDVLRDEIEELQTTIAEVYKQLRELEFLVELTEATEKGGAE